VKGQKYRYEKTGHRGEITQTPKVRRHAEGVILWRHRTGLTGQGLEGEGTRLLCEERHSTAVFLRFSARREPVWQPYSSNDLETKRQK
jgi:hypothetical protein